MRCIALVFLALAACGKEEGPPAPAPEEIADPGDAVPVEGAAPSVDDMRAQSLKEVDREACEAKGGEVMQAGMLGLWRCVVPYADAGKACRDGDECEGRCLLIDEAPPNAAGDIVGQCEANDSPFGCFTEIEGGKIAQSLCVD